MPRSTERSEIAAVILAAGASRRMGRNKLLLELAGESLVRRAARRALGAGFAPVVVVLGYEAEPVRAELAGLPLTFAVNPGFTGPASASLHAGLRQLGPEVDAVVVMLGDMIFVTEAMLAALRTAALSSAAPLVVSRYGAVTAPPHLFRRVLFGELLAWTGEGAGRGVVETHRHEALVVEHPPAVLADVDTPRDFAAAVAQLEG